jgi:integrase
MFKWAASRELMPASVHQSLATLEPLRRGRTTARETDRVLPVTQPMIDAVIPHLSRPVQALVQLQLLTGARPGELLAMRPCDIEFDKAEELWLYRPEQHKNAFRERERLIFLGPQAQPIVKEFLNDRATNGFLFSPKDSVTEHHALRRERRMTAASCGNRPGTNRQTAPRIGPGDRYTTGSYNRAVQYGCDRAFPPPFALARRRGETVKQWRKRLVTEDKWDDLCAWRRAHRFHVNQLRHTAATFLRHEFGLEVAQLVLGHASANITDAVYGERDHGKVIEVMRRIG